MRNREPVSRSLQAGSRIDPSFSASIAGAGVVIASRPKNGAAMPSLVFWSASRNTALPRRRSVKILRVPAGPLAIWSAGPFALRCATSQRSMIGLFGGRYTSPPSKPACRAVNGIISQLAKWPEKNITPLPLATALSAVSRLTTSSRGSGPCSLNLSRCAYSATVRPRLSHISRTMVSISSAVFSGNAARRFSRARFMMPRTR